MEFTLKNYATTLSKDLILLAQKNKVRECDETEKGRFVAYVDEGSESFDVSLELATGGKISAHACDCGAKISFCRHKVALLMEIAAGKKEKVTIKSKKKENKAEALLDDASPDQLKEWVKGLIEKNKDIELSFIHHFSPREQLSPADIIKVTNNAIKAVIGSKKAIDQTQLKKLVDLWTEVHASVITHYRENPMDEKAFLNFHTVLESCLNFRAKIASASNRIPKFIEGVLERSQECIGDLLNEDAWEKAVGYFIDKVPDGVNAVRLHYLVHLKNIIGTSSETRKIKIIGWLAIQFGLTDPERLYDGSAYTKFIFAITNEQGLFPQYYQLFKPIRFDNDYNLQLIGLLIENKYLELAKAYCDQQIRYNYQEEYNIPYLQSLKEIFLIENDRESLGKVKADLFPHTYEFDDYLFIMSTLSEEEGKKWRTKMLSRARNASRRRSRPAMEFCFKLADHEQNYRKMLEYIESYTPYSMILRYFESMIRGDKNKFLEVLMRKSDDDWFVSYASAEDDRRSFPELFAMAEKYYTPGFLLIVIQQAEKQNRLYYRPNLFVTYMKQQLTSS